MPHDPSTRSLQPYLAGTLAFLACLLLALISPAPAQATDTPPAPQLERSIELDDVRYEGSNSAIMSVTDDGAFALVRQFRSSGSYVENEGKYSLTVVNLSDGTQHQFIYDKSPATAFLDSKTALVHLPNWAQSASLMYKIDLASGTSTELDTSELDSVIAPTAIRGIYPGDDGAVAVFGVDMSANPTMAIYDTNSESVTRSCSLGSYPPSLGTDLTFAVNVLLTYAVTDDLSTAYVFDSLNQAQALLGGGAEIDPTCTLRTIDTSSGDTVSTHELSVPAEAQGLVLAPIKLLGNGRILAVNQVSEHAFIVDPEAGTINPLSDVAHTLAAYSDTHVAVLEYPTLPLSDTPDDLVETDLQQQICVIDSATGETVSTNSLPGDIQPTPCLSADGTYLYALKTSGTADVYVRQAFILAYDLTTGASASSEELESQQMFFSDTGTALVDNNRTLVALVSEPSEGPFSINVYATGIEAPGSPVSFISGGAAPVLLGAAGIAVISIIIGAVLTVRRNKKAPAHASTSGPAGRAGAAMSSTTAGGDAMTPSGNHRTTSVPAQASDSTLAPAAPRFCTACGAPLDPHAKFCAHCGSPVAHR